MPSLMNLKFKILACFCIVIFVACDDSRTFDEYKSVNNSWHKDSIISFAFKQNVAGKPYNLFINIRNNNDYKYSNLYIIASMEYPDGFTKVDTLQYLMANPDGTLLGYGFTDTKESKLYYKEKFKFPKPGKYKVIVRQAVRKTGKIEGETSLAGISDVGFRIEQVQK